MGGGAVFNGFVDFEMVGYSFILCVVLTIVIEEATAHIEKSVASQPAHLTMVNQIYKELMILGFVSFILALTVEFGANIPHDLFMAFEWAHFLIFACAMLYVANALLASGAMEATMRSWRRAQHLSVDEAIEDMYAQADSVSCLKLKSRLPLISRQWREDIDYKIVRHVFMAQYGLPRTFDYLSYVKRVLHTNVQHSIHIHAKTWLYIIGITLTIIGGVWLFRVTVDERSQLTVILGEFSNMTVIAGSATLDVLGNMTEEAQDSAAAINTSDVGRRQLGGGGEATVDESYAKDTDQTTTWTIVVCSVFGWVLVVVQVWLTMGVQKVWAKIFDAHGIPNDPDLVRLEASMVEWDAKVDEILDGVETADDYHAKSQRDHSAGIKHQTELQGNADSFFSRHEEHHVASISQLVALVDCFYAAVYAVHLHGLVREFYGEDLVGWLFATAMLIGPSVLLVFVIAPRTMRTTALLCALVRLDLLLVAEVFDTSARMHTVRQEIRSEVAKRHIQSQSEAQGNSEIDSNQMAKEIFESFQANAPKTPKKSLSSLTPQQLKRGLISIGVYIKRKEFEDLVHCIDKHQTGEINLTKWQEFFTLTDEELDALHVDLNSEGNLVLMSGVLHTAEVAVNVGTAIVGTATLGILAPMPQPLAKVLPGGQGDRTPRPDSGSFNNTAAQSYENQDSMQTFENPIDEAAMTQ